MVACLGIAFSRKTKHGIRNWGTAVGIFAALHYWSAGLDTAAWSNVLSMVATWALGTRDTKTKVPIWIFISFVLGNILVVTLTWAGPQSTLPGAAQILGLITIWFKNPRTVIITRMCVEPIWVVYNIIGLTIYGLAASTALLLGGWYRLTHNTVDLDQTPTKGVK